MPREIHKGEISTLSIALNDEAFAALVSGQVAKVRAVAADHMVNVEIILSDIGWPRMFELIRAAMENRPPRELSHPGGRYPR
jgi:hypothetical protein